MLKGVVAKENAEQILSNPQRSNRCNQQQETRIGKRYTKLIDGPGCDDKSNNLNSVRLVRHFLVDQNLSQDLHVLAREIAPPALISQ